MSLDECWGNREVSVDDGKSVLGFYWQKQCIDEAIKTDNPVKYMNLIFEEYDKVTSVYGSGRNLLKKPSNCYVDLMERKWKQVYNNLFSEDQEMTPVDNDIFGWPV